MYGLMILILDTFFILLTYESSKFIIVFSRKLSFKSIVMVLNGLSAVFFCLNNNEKGEFSFYQSNNLAKYGVMAMIALCLWSIFVECRKWYRIFVYRFEKNTKTFVKAIFLAFYRSIVPNIVFPVIEELVFRSFFFSLLIQDDFSHYQAIFISSVAYSIVHFSFFINSQLSYSNIRNLLMKSIIICFQALLYGLWANLFWKNTKSLFHISFIAITYNNFDFWGFGRYWNSINNNERTIIRLCVVFGILFFFGSTMMFLTMRSI